MTYGAYRRVSISGVYTKGVRKKRRLYWKTGKRRDRLRNPGQVPGTRTHYTSNEPISTSDTVSFSTLGNITLAFHHDTFANSGDPYGDGTLAGATATCTSLLIHKRVRILGEPFRETRYEYEYDVYVDPTKEITGADVLMVAGGVRVDHMMLVVVVPVVYYTIRTNISGTKNNYYR
jgi:hypothetical protein